jgi:N,N'-diacetyllegionaminate synthase
MAGRRPWREGHTYVIAEAGVNHNGSLELAFELIDRAAAAGVDAVKFQIGTPELVVSRFAPKAEYQKQTTGTAESQLDMVRKLQLPQGSWPKLVSHCATRGVAFLASPFDLPSVDYLATLDTPAIKVPSGELTNLPYLRAVGRTGLPVLLSTGMCDLEEVRRAIRVLVDNGTSHDEILVFQCTTEYPAPAEEANLRAMQTMASEFSIPVGYSDHTLGLELSLAAVGMGAQSIEKHFTLDKTMEGPDHAASVEPEELAELVRAIRVIESALGDGVKRPAASEIKNQPIARKSIVAARPIAAGEEFTEDNLTTKRPGSGITPMQWDEVIGTHAPRAFEADELIEL